MMQEAHEHGLSFGKYSAYQTLLEYDSSITIDGVRGRTMAQIRSLISENGGS